MRRSAPAAAGGKASHPSNRVSQSQSRSKSIRGRQRRQMMLPHIPCRTNQRRQQSTRKHSTRAQCTHTENFARMIYVKIPINQDVENLRPDNAGQHHQNSQIPGSLRINPLLLGITHADPQPHQHSQGHQESIRGQAKSSDVKKLWKHYFVRCGKTEFDRPSVSGETRKRKFKPTH